MSWRRPFFTSKRYNSSASEAVSPDFFFTAGSEGPDIGKLAYYFDTGATFDASKTCNPDFLQQFTGAGLPNELKSRELDSAKPLVVMCHSGGRSRRVAEFLKGNGFLNVFNLMGGIDAWSAQIDSRIPRY